MRCSTWPSGLTMLDCEVLYQLFPLKLVNFNYPCSIKELNNVLWLITVIDSGVKLNGNCVNQRLKTFGG